MYNRYCEHHFGNGHCDEGCNNAECNWDGMDCVEKGEDDYAKGLLVFIIGMPPDNFTHIVGSFLRDFGTMLRTTLIVAKDSNRDDMIYPYSGDSRRTKRAASGER